MFVRKRDRKAPCIALKLLLSLEFVTHCRRVAASLGFPLNTKSTEHQ